MMVDLYESGRIYARGQRFWVDLCSDALLSAVIRFPTLQSKILFSDCMIRVEWLRFACFIVNNRLSLIRLTQHVSG